MMTASNLSICVGPSLIWTMDQSYMMEQNYSKEVSSLVQILIEQYHQLYDTETPELFCQGEPVRPEAGAGGAARAGALESAGAPAERTSLLTSNNLGVQRGGGERAGCLILASHQCLSSVRKLIK